MLEEELLKHDMFQANSELNALGFGTGKSFLTKGATPDISSSRNSQGSFLVTTHHWPLKASMSLCYTYIIWPYMAVVFQQHLGGGFNWFTAYWSNRKSLPGEHYTHFWNYDYDLNIIARIILNQLLPVIAWFFVVRSVAASVLRRISPYTCPSSGSKHAKYQPTRHSSPNYSWT